MIFLMIKGIKVHKVLSKYNMIPKYNLDNDCYN